MVMVLTTVNANGDGHNDSYGRDGTTMVTVMSTLMVMVAGNSNGYGHGQGDGDGDVNDNGNGGGDGLFW